MTTPINRLNQALSGSPYTLSDDERGVKRGLFLLNEMETISDRHRAVEGSFASEVPAVRERLQRLIRARSVYESNALELTGLPLADTEREISLAPQDLDKLAQYLVDRAVTSDRHLVDVLGLHRANMFVNQLANEYHSDLPVSEIDVRALHAATVPTERFAGEYRQIEVQISGSGHEPPPFYDVPRQMSELVAWLNTTEAPPPLAATVVHSWLTIIHPFQDGNGRVARLLANLVLLRNGWPTLIVRASDRLQYLDALSSSDEAGDILPLFDLFVKSIKRSLKEISRPGLAVDLYEADLRARPNLQFEMWSNELKAFLDELRVVLNADDFELIRMSVPSVSTYLLLQDGDSSGNTWLAKIRHPDGRDYLLWLGFMTHEMKDYGGPPLQAPSIFVSERNRGEDTVHPYSNPLLSGSPISIDEISLIPSARERACLIRTARFNVEEFNAVEAARQLAKAISDAI